MNTKTHQFDLIRTTYRKEEAKEVLNRLVDDKITFLKRTIFSLQERFGEDTSHLERRVDELSLEKTELKKMIANLGENEELSIECPVFVTIKTSSAQQNEELTQA